MKKTAIDKPALSERPTDYAARVGKIYCDNKPIDFRKNLGIYFTPQEVAQYMASLRNRRHRPVQILDPAAGVGILLCALVEDLIDSGKGVERVKLVGYEVDRDLCNCLDVVLDYLKTWAQKHKMRVEFDIINKDFILEHADSLQSAAEPLFSNIKREQYDIVISNPPYFKIPKSDKRAQAASSVVHGQPNIYGLFMAVGASLLKAKGELIYITPRSFASGPYFKLFRKKFFQTVRPTRIHIFASRTEAFRKDDVLQENVIVYGIREEGWLTNANNKSIIISSSGGANDLRNSTKRKLSVPTVLDWQSEDKVLKLPATASDDDVLTQVDQWPETLISLGMNISTGPVVPFRATEFLAHDGDFSSKYAPLLWMHHVHPLSVTWPNGTRKAQYIKREALERKLLLPNVNYVILRRFSAKEEKRRLTAAPYLKNRFEARLTGFENHLNYIHRPGGELTDDEVWGLSALYSSTLMDSYFRIINGNTQVSATELRVMPIPSHEQIVALGKRIKKLRNPLSRVDDLVNKLCGASKNSAENRRVVNG